MVSICRRHISCRISRSIIIIIVVAFISIKDSSMVLYTLHIIHIRIYTTHTQTYPYVYRQKINRQRKKIGKNLTTTSLAIEVLKTHSPNLCTISMTLHVVVSSFRTIQRSTIREHRKRKLESDDRTKEKFF